MQTMNSKDKEPQPPYISMRFLLLVSAAVVATGLFLALVGAPFWTFYVAPLVMGPFMFHEFRAQEAAATKAEQQSRQERHPRRRPKPQSLG